MAIHIAVVDPLPMFQQGVAATLSAVGHTVEAPTDVAEWVPRDERSVVLLTLCVERDWEQLWRLHDRFPGQAVIALVEEESVAVGVRAIQSGARSVLSRHVMAGALERAVEATIDGQAVMPAPVAAALAGGMPPGIARQVPLSSQQLSWLRRLATGVTVARLASDTGYSERAMYRLLHSLYKKMGVENRIQAILLGQEQGWLATETNPPGMTHL
ncbi:MAG: DNA-binding response regulator [Pseudonocardiaceae bacterium]